MLETIKQEQVKQKSLLKFLNISPVQKQQQQQQQQHAFSVRKSTKGVLSKAKFSLQKRTVKDYKWHPFLGLC